MNTIGVQTEQFLMFIDFQHKLTKINDHIKALKERQNFYKFKNEYLQYKNQTLMDSLFYSERSTQEGMSARKLSIINDIETIQGEIERQIKETVQIKIQQSKQKRSTGRSCLGDISNCDYWKQKIKNTNTNTDRSKHCSVSKKTEKENVQCQTIEKMNDQIRKLKTQIKQVKLQNHRVFQMNGQLKARSQKVRKLLQYQEMMYMKQQDRMQAKVNIEKFKSQVLLMKYKDKDNSQITQDAIWQGQESGLFDSQTKRKYR